MAPKAHTAVIDGEKYFIRRVDPFAGLRLSTLCGRSIGPLISSVATSPNVGALVRSIASGGKSLDEGIEVLLDTDILAVASVLGVSLEHVAESLGEEDLVRLVRLAIIGHVSTVHEGIAIDIDDDGTYADILGPRIAKHSMLHQLKLIWEVVRLNLGPTTAAAPTSLLEGSTAPA